MIKFKSANLWDKVKSGFTSLKSTFKELIFDPLSEWWDGGGKEVIISGAAQLGTWLGEGITNGVEFLSNGILSLLGINENEVFSEATAVGKSFWDAFTDAFDGSRIMQAITSAISGVWSVIPAGDQMLLGGYGAAKALSGISPVIKGVQSVASVIGSVSKGTGILGVGAKAVSGIGTGFKHFSEGTYDISQDLGYKEGSGVAYGLGQKLFTVGNSLDATGSGTSVALQGAGAIGGGITAGITLISAGKDIYNATQTEGTESTYNAAKGGTKIAGVATGAAISTMILPGVGTLIGAGIGGLVGSAASDSVAKGISGYDEASESAEEYVARIEGLNSTMEGYSEEAKEVMRQTSLTGERFKEIEKTNLDKWYGDVALSLSEINELSDQAYSNVMGEENIDMLNKYKASVESTNQALARMENAEMQLQKGNYQLEVGMTLNETDSQSYALYVEEYVDGLQEYLSGRRYEAKLGIDCR